MEKVYLSGPITNTPDAPERFAKAEEFYTSRGYEVVNPLKYNHVDTAWEVAMRKDIELLMQCQAIAMLPGWQASRGALLEHYLASQLGMRMLYLYEPMPPKELVFRAIEDMYGYTPSDLKSADRNTRLMDARRIAASLLREKTNYTYSHLGLMLNRDYTTVIYLVKSCAQLRETDRSFATHYNAVRELTLNYLSYEERC